MAAVFGCEFTDELWVPQRDKTVRFAECCQATEH